MRISTTHRFVFLSYPRTASRSVRQLLDPVSDIKGQPLARVSEDAPYYNHIPAWSVAENMRRSGKDFGDYYSFCFVRNPFERVASLLEEANRRATAAGRALMDGDAFVARIARVHANPSAWFDTPFRMAAPLRYFICDRQGHRLISQVYRFEDLEAAKTDISRRAGLPGPPAKMPEVGVDKSLSVPDAVFDTATLDAIAAIYDEEIAEFGYDRPETAL